MCGRYTQMRTWAELLDLYGIAESLSPSNFPARYNIAPTQAVPVVRQQQASGERELVTLRWGLVPSWAKDIAIGARMINARAETLADKPSFRAAFKERRCLIVADGFYEWQARPKGPKQPWFITVEDARPFAFAGLWEEWWDAGSTLIETCTIVTTEANAALRPIHARMPAILPPGRFDAWLDPAAAVADLKALLAPYAGAMATRPVGRRVNVVGNDDPSCVEPATED
jgi:putative SOS response-associated peptidase YedK